MPYYTKVLQPDETVKAVGRLHWSIYGRAFVVLILAVAVLVGSFWLPDPDWPRYGQIASGVIAVVGLVLLLKAGIRRMATEIVVTDRRVILNKGFVRRHTTEMNMSKVNSGAMARCGFAAQARTSSRWKASARLSSSATRSLRADELH